MLRRSLRDCVARHACAQGPPPSARRAANRRPASTSHSVARAPAGLAMAVAELVDQRRIESRIGSSASRLPVRIIQAASAPAPSRPKASKVAVDDLARVGLAAAGAHDRFGDRGRDRSADRPRQLRLQPRRRAEMVEQIGVGPADLGRRPPSASPPAGPGRSAAAAPRPAPRPGSPPGSGVYDLLTFVSAIRHRCKAYLLRSPEMTAASETDRARPPARPDHHPARPALRPRHAPAALVARRRSGRHRVYNALSATFPKGEAFFVESVRQFRDGAPPKLAEEIKAFTTQEAIHSREHAAFNKRGARGRLRPDAARGAGRLIGCDHRPPPIANLAATMALEHFTAILAHELLKDPRHLGRPIRRAPPVALACDRGDRAQGRRLRHLAARHPPLAAVASAGRSRRKVMLFVTRNFIVDRTSARSSCCARTASPARGPGRGCSGSPGSPRHDAPKIFGAWAPSSCPASTRGTRTTAT